MSTRTFLGPWALLLIILAGVKVAEGAGTPPIVRVEPRQWNLPIDRPVGSHTARVVIKDDDSNTNLVNVTIAPPAVKFGGFFDGSDFFEAVRLPEKEKGVSSYEIRLKKPLYGSFKIGDKMNLNIKAQDESYTFSNEVSAEVEPPVNPDFTTDDLTTTSTTRLIPVTTATTTAATAEAINSSPSSTTTTEAAAATETGGTIFVVTIVPIFIVLPALGVAAYFFRRRLRKVFNCCSHSKPNSESKREVQTVLSSPRTEVTELQSRKTSLALSSSYDSQSAVQTKEWNYLDPWEFPRHHLKIFGILGEGCFGQVWKAEASNIVESEATTIVAVKTLKESASEKEKKDLLQELGVMKMLDPHPNVVKLLGCCTEKDPVFVIMEYVAKGKLQELLRKSRAEQYYGNLHGSSQKLTSRDLTQFCYHVARGMDYLSSKKVIHRDLAARNILVTEEKICKVADFGFSRDVMINNIYERKSEGRLPIRWMAPESLYDNLYTTKTDVWSFGVLMWEVVTLGSTPYPGMSGSEVMKRVKEGHRLEKPEHCDREMYNIMYYCWDKDPTERPTFSQLVKDFENMLMKDTDYIDLNQFPDHAYYNEVSLSGEKV